MLTPTRWRCGVDVGTTHIGCLIARVTAEGAQEFRGSAVIPHRAFDAGRVVDLALLVDALREALARAEQEAQTRIHQGWLTATVTPVTSRYARGVLWLAERGREIRPRDIERVVQRGRNHHVDFNEEVLHIIPLGYEVDGQNGIGDPTGLFGSQMAAELHLVATPTAPLRNLIKAAQLAGLEVNGVIHSGFATALACLTPAERQGGALTLDIGGTGTDVAIISGNRLRYVAYLPGGGERLTHALAERRGVPRTQAEGLKRTFVVSRDREIVTIFQQELRTLFTDVRKTCASLAQTSTAFEAVVVSGRTALMDGVVELAEEILQRPTRLGVAEDVEQGSLEQRMSLTTACGLLRYLTQAQRPTAQRSLPGPPWLARPLERVVTLYQNYF